MGHDSQRGSIVALIIAVLIIFALVNIEKVCLFINKPLIEFVIFVVKSYFLIEFRVRGCTWCAILNLALLKLDYKLVMCVVTKGAMYGLFCLHSVVCPVITS